MTKDLKFYFINISVLITTDMHFDTVWEIVYYTDCYETGWPRKKIEGLGSSSLSRLWDLWLKSLSKLICLYLPSQIKWFFNTLTGWEMG